jgi:ribosomal protein L37AE/L43A
LRQQECGGQHPCAFPRLAATGGRQSAVVAGQRKQYRRLWQGRGRRAGRRELRGAGRAVVADSQGAGSGPAARRHARHPEAPTPVPRACAPQFAMKRQAVGIWGCRACKKVVAGGAYVMR